MPPGGPAKLTREQASSLARLALKGIRKEFPEQAGANVSQQRGRRQTAAHAAPGLLRLLRLALRRSQSLDAVRLLRLFPDLPEAKDPCRPLEHLTAKNLKAEADSFARPNARSFERTYGWAWLLKLAEELHGWDDADAKKWSKNLKPLADTIVAAIRPSSPSRLTRSERESIRTPPSGWPSPSTTPGPWSTSRSARTDPELAAAVTSPGMLRCRRRGSRAERTSSRQA